MRTVSACAADGTTTMVATVEQTAATVSAASRAEDLLGNGIPPGMNMGAGTKVTRVVQWGKRDPQGGWRRA
ncbi:hypothetical protein QFZ49_001738 [Streptomyces turgidiscabies]|uniref:Uncharacterized protein n=1 Tax=Streptomyces turgidiscabies TaxID=85558 RepID=A0ABU0RIL8_9ACTN|nr:hypothetical protein [Streptomyces turgidiscabies]